MLRDDEAAGTEAEPSGEATHCAEVAAEVAGGSVAGAEAGPGDLVIVDLLFHLLRCTEQCGAEATPCAEVAAEVAGGSAADAGPEQGLVNPVAVAEQDGDVEKSTFGYLAIRCETWLYQR